MKNNFLFLFFSCCFLSFTFAVCAVAKYLALVIFFPIFYVCDISIRQKEWINIHIHMYKIPLSVDFPFQSFCSGGGPKQRQTITIVADDRRCESKQANAIIDLCTILFHQIAFSINNTWNWSMFTFRSSMAHFEDDSWKYFERLVVQ